MISNLSGSQSLFANSIKSYPFSNTYLISYTQSLQQPTSYFDLVISINSFDFTQCNSYGWNFTKSDITVTGFNLKFQAGINLAIYTLAINYMLVDHSYLDYEIAYFSTSSFIKRQTMYYNEPRHRLQVRERFLYCYKVYQ